MLKDTWVDKRDGVDKNSAEDINQVAHAVIDLENDGGSGVHIGSEAPEDGSDVWIDPSEQPEIGEPDWAANEGDAGHIKNRTHYVDTFGKVHKLDNKFINSEWMATKEESGGAIVVPASNLAFTGASIFLSTYNMAFLVTLGVKYDVHWNGAVYTCEPKLYDGEVFLGNGSLVHNVDDTGEPFCFYGILSAEKITVVNKSTSEAESIDLLITTHVVREYNKLPKEYLPDDIGGSIDVTASVGQTIIVKEVDENGKPTKWESADYQPRTHWSEEGLVQVSLFPKYRSTLQSEYGFYGFVLVFNEYATESTYLTSVHSIEYDGVEYTNPATVELSGTHFCGNLYFLNQLFGASFVDTGEPFLLGGTVDGTTMFTLDTQKTDHTVQIYIDGTNHQRIDLCYTPKIPVIDLTPYYSNIEFENSLTISGDDYFEKVYKVLQKNEIVRFVYSLEEGSFATACGFTARLQASNIAVKCITGGSFGLEVNATPTDARIKLVD